ncbi:hypothetical protein Scep_003003 [Stephania cephalantha]|uniref:DNA repair RAD52-like protein 1, mitochondrial n=1 Tax=Stephania cephalantha TaxID=152367 RepID=A0AAP0Q4V2_9MAGN
MASLLIKTLFKSSSPSAPSLPRLRSAYWISSRSFGRAASPKKERVVETPICNEVVAEEATDVPTSGISRPLSEILKELSRKVPDSHIVNRIMNLHAPEWSGEVRSITYSPDGKSVSVVYRVTLYGTDAEIYRESSGTASVNDTNFGDPVQKAEAMAFRRACARLGLGLHLYHDDIL